MTIIEKLRARADRRVLSSIAYAADCGLDREAANEIERLREALHRIQHSPNGTKVYCRDGHEEAVLIARAALGEDK